jgi:hypothetical protein
VPRPSKIIKRQYERPPAEEFVSQLPAYQAKRSKDFPAFLIVYCSYDDCPGTAADRPFLVAEEAWMRKDIIRVVRTGKDLVITGRSCPYCFRTGRLPEEQEIG